MLPERLRDGRIRTPVTVGGGKNDDFIGDATVVLKPGDEGYDELDTWLKRRGE